MKKKILMMSITILSIVIVITPFIGAVGAWKNEQTYVTVLQLGTGTPYPGYPKDMPPQSMVNLFFKNMENMVNYKITIGSTTYNLGEDFTYDGVNWGKDTLDKPRTLLVKYTYTFLPASGIDGTLVLTAKGTADLSVTPPVFDGWIRGHGTGELRGVIVVADLGVAIVDPTWGPALSHIGMIYNWPDM